MQVTQSIRRATCSVLGGLFGCVLAATAGIAAPAVAQSAPRETAYALLPRVTSVHVSPNGERLVMLTGEHQGERVVSVVPLVAGAEPRAFSARTSYGPAAWVRWLSNEHLLVGYMVRVEDVSENTFRDTITQAIVRVEDLNSIQLDENVSLLSIDPDEEDSVLMWVGSRGGVSGTGTGSRLERAAGGGLFRYELDRDRNRRVPGLTADSVAILGPDHEPALRFRGGGEAASAFVLWRRDGRGWTQIHEERYELNREFRFQGWRQEDWTGVIMDVAGLSSDGDYAYFSSVTRGETGTRNPGRRQAVYRIALADGAIEGPIVESGMADINTFLTDWRTNAVIGVRWEEDRPRVRYFDPDFAALQADIEAAFPNSNVSLTRWDMAFRRVVIHVSGGDTPGAWYLLDNASGEVQLIGETRPAISAAQIAPTRRIDYEARDGAPLWGYLTTPVDRPTENLPLVLMPHGGPEARDHYGFDPVVQMIAMRGYAVFQPQFRGSAGFGRDFAEAGYERWNEAMQTDLYDGMDHLAAQGLIDPDRACIMGWSYGGYAALAAAAFEPDRFRCAIAGAAVTDLPEMMDYAGEVSGFLRLYWARNIGDWRGRSGWLESISPARHADRITIPVLLAHGHRDLIVPYAQSEIMADALDAAGKPYEFIDLPGSGHHDDRMSVYDRRNYFRAVIDFLYEHNWPD